jgi:hypothetical protein
MGKALGHLYGGYTAGFSWLAPVWHVAAVVVVVLGFVGGNRYRRVFAGYFLANYVWGLAFVGLWVSVRLVQQLGPQVLLFYGATPVFLLLIVYEFYREVRHPRLDIDFSHAKPWRFAISVPVMVWALWYPPYTWGRGFDFAPSAFVFGAYGLMTCPLTMMALSALFLTYPKGNRRLFNLLTAYSLFGGLGMVALLWFPDVPFFLMGLAALSLAIGLKLMRPRRLIPSSP